MSLESEQPPRRRGEKIKEIGLLFSLDSFGSDPSDAGTFLELGSGLDAKIVLFWSSIVWPFVECGRFYLTTWATFGPAH